jgi:hypothetical protein
MQIFVCDLCKDVVKAGRYWLHTGETRTGPDGTENCQVSIDLCDRHAAIAFREMLNFKGQAPFIEREAALLRAMKANKEK